MKPTIDLLERICPGLDRPLAAEHLSRLDDRYFEQFGPEQVCRHLEHLGRLGRLEPARAVVDASRDGGVECTVFSFDYPSLFSIIAGTLTGLGFEIESGHVFTYAKPAQWSPAPRRGGCAPNVPPELALLRRRRIIDSLHGHLPEGVSRRTWAERFAAELVPLIAELEKGTAEAIDSSRRRVNELVAGRLSRLPGITERALYPVSIEIESSAGPFTRMHVVSQDTPAFLYALSNALALGGISVEQVGIDTLENTVHDTIDVADAAGEPVRDPDRIDRLKLSVLLTKQFTYFLPQAPDPYAALQRFEKMVRDLVTDASSSHWTEALADPTVLRDLARLLGTSDFLWEDFIRLQYETLLPMLEQSGTDRVFATAPARVEDELRQAVGRAAGYGERVAALNEFKDREVFRIDLEHILDPAADFRFLSSRLTRLAECVIAVAVEVVHERLIERFGAPLTVAGLPARLAVFGLGKMGGLALGYASDIELQFVYGDSGRTGGPEVIDNAEFFDRLVKETTHAIEAKREGIFDLDLRLRPHGNDGPLACSLDNWCRYYAAGGAALSYERLSLVRLRFVAGDRALGEQVERIRDDIVYRSKGIKPREIQELREKQYRAVNRPGELNAKFSPGALVDLEYDVQLLQVMHGNSTPSLRTPNLREALKGLAAAGVLGLGESRRLSAAYDFYRRLINSLRMLRGSARDLFLPAGDSLEFTHLSRRMGYAPTEGMSPSQRLRVDFAAHGATVRAFVERHFGRETLPGEAAGNAADLVLSNAIPDSRAHEILRETGFVNPERALVNLRSLAGSGPPQATFARLSLVACEMLHRTPDPDMALNNWERHVAAMADSGAHFDTLLSQPTRLQILLAVFAGSQYLADSVIRDPEFLEWVIDPDHLRHRAGADEVESEYGVLSEQSPAEAEWHAALRRRKRRDILRIAIRDLCLHAPVREITEDISALAEGVVRTVLNRALLRASSDGPRHTLCLLAFGKLGGRELNYSSDIDLLAVFDGESGKSRALTAAYARIVEQVIADLSRHTDQGAAYRVDLRLRPFGGAGSPVHTLDALERYYCRNAAHWEVQALLKLRPIAGDSETAAKTMERLRSALVRKWDAVEVARSIAAMRSKSHQARAATSLTQGVDLKNGPGGIRDIEFLVQGMQLANQATEPGVLEGSTLGAIEALGRVGVLDHESVDQLSADYAFLRRVEHFLQLYEDRQTHTLPTRPADLLALAKRVSGVDATAELFAASLERCRERVEEAFGAWVASPR